MRYTLHNLLNLVIRGFEDEEEESSEENEEEHEEEKETPPSGGNVDGLRSALQKERTGRKTAEKQLAAERRAREERENKEKSELEVVQQSATKANAKVTALANRLRDAALDNAILKASAKYNFRDPDDALKLVDRDVIDYDQDEDDPSKVTITMDTVQDALKKLAKAKPHLVVAEGQEEKSGSKFNGGTKSKQELDDDLLRAKFPALNRGQ